MPDIAGHNRDPGVERDFDEREIARVRYRAGDRSWCCEQSLPANEREDFLYRILRKSEFISHEHVCIFIKDPRVEKDKYAPVDDEVEDAGGSAPGREQS
jgi:hypothetical protein